MYMINKEFESVETLHKCAWSCFSFNSFSIGSFQEERDWNYVAMVLDRLFLIFFLTASLLGTTSIFLLPPTLYDRAIALTKDNVNCSR